MNNEVIIRDEFNIYNENTYNRLVNLSERYATSGITPYSLRNKPNDIFIVLMMGLEMKMMPGQAMQCIDCIQGRPALKPMAMTGLIKLALPMSHIQVIKDTPTEVFVTMGRDRNYKEDWYTSRWTLDRAKSMGLSGKDNWKKQAQTMLRWRAISEAARMVFPDIILGLYTPDEVSSFDDIEQKHNEAVKKIQEKRDDIEMNEKIMKKEKPEDNLDEFVVSVGSLKGKKLKDIDNTELLDFYLKAKKHFNDGKEPMSQKDKILLNVLEMYLQEKGLID